MILQKPRVVCWMPVCESVNLITYKYMIKHWLQLQNNYRCFFYVADLSALFKGNCKDLSVSTWELVKDWLAIGIDPDKVTIFIQSAVSEYAEMYLLLSMLVPLLSLKSQDHITEHDTHGIIGLPILQVVDIFLYKPEFIMENLQNINFDIVREIISRFNSLFGYGKNFVDKANIALNKMVVNDANEFKKLFNKIKQNKASEVDLTKIQQILIKQNKLSSEDKKNLLDYIKNSNTPIFKSPEKIDCAEMAQLMGHYKAKTYNALHLFMDPELLAKKIMALAIDPTRFKRTDKGDPEKCSVWPLHKLYSNDAIQSWVEVGCKSAGIGCLECKNCLIENVLVEQREILKRRKEYDNNSSLVRQIVRKGVLEAQTFASSTLADIRRLMGFARR